MSPRSCSFLFFFLARFIAVVSTVSFILYVILAMWPPSPQIQLPALLFVCVLLVLFLLFVLVLLVNQGRSKAVPWRLFCFGSFVILDVVCSYLSLFMLYINIKIGKNRCFVRLAGDHLYGK